MKIALRTEEFRWLTDSDRGPGWLFLKMPHFDTVKGFGLAHDMLEHVDTWTGITGECRAFGAMLWIRGTGDYWAEAANREQRPYSMRTTCHEIGQELGDLLADADGDVLTTDVQSPVEDDEGVAEAWIEWMLGGVIAASRFADEPSKTPTADTIERMRNWIRDGYRNAEQFYGCRADAVAQLFRELEEAIDKASVGREEGDEIAVTVYNDCTFAIETVTGVDAEGNYWIDGVKLDAEE